MADLDAEREQFMASIRRVESGGRYSIGKNAAGASGAYQFLDSTWGGYGGYPSAYLAPPAVQDARARQLMGEYYRRFGSWGAVAQAWLGGPGSVGKNVKDKYTGITSNEYVKKVLAGTGVVPGAAPTAMPRPAPTTTAVPQPAVAPLPPDLDPHNIGFQLENFKGILAGLAGAPSTPATGGGR